MSSLPLWNECILDVKYKSTSWNFFAIFEVILVFLATESSRLIKFN